MATQGPHGPSPDVPIALLKPCRGTSIVQCSAELPHLSHKVAESAPRLAHYLTASNCRAVTRPTMAKTRLSCSRRRLIPRNPHGTIVVCLKQLKKQIQPKLPCYPAFALESRGFPLFFSHGYTSSLATDQQSLVETLLPLCHVTSVGSSKREASGTSVGGCRSICIRIPFRSYLKLLAGDIHSPLQPSHTEVDPHHHRTGLHPLRPFLFSPRRPSANGAASRRLTITVDCSVEQIQNEMVSQPLAQK